MPTLQIESGAFFLLAMGLLMLPLDWLIGALLAAVFHELCHLAMARKFGVKCFLLQIGVGGAVLEFAPMTVREEFCIALAGPLGSFLLLTFVRAFPQLAVCGLVQGAFNLLPVFPLDGGRMMTCLLGERARILEWITYAVLLFLGVWAGWNYGFYPLFFIAIVAAKAFLRKIPCKAAALGVQ